MRWDRLFADLEAQWDAEERRERDAEVADRTRRERAAVTLVGRLGAHRERRVRVRVSTGAVVDGEVADLGGDWLLVRRPEAAREVLVPLGAVAAVIGLGERSVKDETARRFALGYALRALSRDRVTVAVTDSSGQVVTGTIDHVGADALDLSEHAVGEPRRSANVSRRRTVPFSAVVLVESR